jgi:DNA-binding MarR family transcriptional regulator
LVKGRPGRRGIGCLTFLPKAQVPYSWTVTSVSEGTDARWLTAEEMRCWRAFVEASGGMIQLLDSCLKRDGGITFDDYEVLVHLSEAPNRRLRMSDLSSRLLHSQSRVTQRIDRLVCRGWVLREKCVDDRRVTYAVLTDTGFRAIEEAAPHHVGHVRRHLLDFVEPHELEMLSNVYERLVTHVREQRGEHGE